MQRWLMVAMLVASSGDKGCAVDDLRKSLELNPNNPQAKQSLDKLLGSK